MLKTNWREAKLNNSNKMTARELKLRPFTIKYSTRKKVFRPIETIGSPLIVSTKKPQDSRPLRTILELKMAVKIVSIKIQILF